MSEGGRKVWNREQLLALNNGAIVLIKIEPKPAARRLGFTGFHGPASKQSGSGMPVGFYLFGQDIGYTLNSIVEEYPIEVIWEPNE